MGREIQEFPSKIFFVSLPEKFVGELFIVSRYRKTIL